MEENGEDYNVNDMPTYVGMPKGHTYAKKKWQKRKRENDTTTVGRVHSVNPLAGDVFYLRMLLHHDHCRGKTSCKDLVTIDMIKYNRYQSVCHQVALLSDDKEWKLVLTHICPIKIKVRI